MTSSTLSKLALSFGCGAILCVRLAASAGLQMPSAADRAAIGAASAAERDRELKLLGIGATRAGVTANNIGQPGNANFDESKANPYPKLPEVLRFNNGKPVKTAADWKRRREEIKAMFGEDVYGKFPAHIPGVTWKLESVEEMTVQGVPAVVKHVIGHVDNSADPAIVVDLHVDVVTPASTRGTRVPVIIGGGPARPRPSFPRPPAPAPGQVLHLLKAPEDAPDSAKLLLEKGWGFVGRNSNEVQADNGAGLNKGIIGLVNKGQPLDHMLHVAFENFVWLTPAEIEAAIHAKFPLFNDFLPENSPHQDDIKAALTAALAAKSISAEVVSDTFEPTLRHPIRAITFSVSKPSIRIANVKLGGVTPGLVPLVQKSVNATAGTLYTEGPADQTTADRILAPLLDAGYVQAALTDVVPAPSAAANGEIAVVLSAKLIPGEVFQAAGITFTGTPLYAASDFTAAAKLHPGDIASRAALIASLAPIDAAYRRKGYMDVVVDAVPTLDAAARQVTYNVQVTPGEPYRIHEVTPNNLDPAARADFDRYFLQKPGEIYNPEYVAGFLKNNTALRSFNGYAANFKAYADPNTHTVDLVVNFYKRSL
jgi:outer membrane protein insertion porin family